MFLQNSDKPINIWENASSIWEVTYKSINDLVIGVFGHLPFIISGILVLILFWIFGRLIKAIFWTATEKARLDNRLRILFTRLIGIAIIVVGIFTAFTIIVPSFRFGDLIAGLGFTSFIVGFAAKDILNNLFSGVLILWQQPFRIGDYIFVKEKQGKVEYIGVRATTLKMDDGEKILMPNGEMYSNALVIRGAGAERRMKLNISIGYGTDIKQAKANILSALQNLDGVVEEPKSNVYVTDLASEGVKLSIYFWINTDKHSAMEVTDKVATEIKEALMQANVEIYPPGAVIIQNSENNAPTVDYTNRKEDF
jgi:small-conductance mechanosensitive channel